VQFIEGNPSEALTDPNTIVLTQKLANKLFNFNSALGKIIKVDGVDLMVTGVVADPPKNTHFKYSYINSFPHESWVSVGNWTGNNFFTYAKLSPGATVDQVHAKIPELVRQYVGPELIKYSGHDTFEDFLAAGGKKTFSLLPMADLHLHYPHLADYTGSIDNVYIFTATAIFILLIACINFMNLSTARSAMRSKEVGMRKVLGSLRYQLIQQFLTESFLICLLAALLAIGVAVLVLPAFNQIANRNFNYSDIINASTLVQLIGLMIVVGFLAGAYPALVLSAFKPIKALKGEAGQSSRGGGLLRKGLVAFQFAISILLIVSTVVVFYQLQFIKKQDLGLNTDQVLVVKNLNRLPMSGEALRNRLNELPSIKSASLMNQYPSQWISDWGYQTLEDNPRSYGFRNLFADQSFIETMGLNLLDGRNFNQQLASDTANILINQAAANWLGYDDPIGQKLSRGDGEDYTIIGVIQDFNYESLKSGIDPMIIRMMRTDGRVEGDWYAGNYLSLKLSGNITQSVKSIEDMWYASASDEPFEYEFLDEAYNSLYMEEERFGQLFTAASGLAIIIACLGLFALAAFTLQRRYKEIAVRKVLGASVQNLTFMVIRSFTLLVLVGALIAIPAGYLLMTEWLASFAYQINLNNPLIWVLPALLVAIIAWLTVGFQSIKTATSNPVKALRSE
ncbi:MAG TPA: ABC transporter permease, partial [Roseivirga sp.]